jgi:hypothetical protein
VPRQSKIVVFVLFALGIELRGQSACNALTQADWIESRIDWKISTVERNRFSARKVRIVRFEADGAVRVLAAGINEATRELYIDRSSNLLYWSGSYRCTGNQVKLDMLYLGRVPVATNLPVDVVSLRHLKLPDQLRIDCAVDKRCILRSSTVNLIPATSLSKEDRSEFLAPWPPYGIKNP